MTRIVVIGDIHGFTQYMARIIDIEKPDFVLQTGDMSEYVSYDTPVYYVMGHDEDEDTLKNYIIPHDYMMELHNIRNGVRNHKDKLITLKIF